MHNKDYELSDLFHLIHFQLLELSNPNYAHKANAYLLNQFNLLGIYTKDRNLIVKNFNFTLSKEQLFELVNLLYSNEYRDSKYVAISLLKKYIQLLDYQDLPIIKQMILIEPWWETVDSIAPIIGKLVINHQYLMDSWINDDNFWIRRIAIIHQIGWKSKTNKELLLKYCLKQSYEKEFFIRKAIGWALRDYARVNPIFVLNFMNQNKEKFSNLTFREATKHII